MNPPDDENLRYGRYNVLRRDDGTPWELGRGGMGVTYKAEDPELRRTVVLKVIRADLLGNDPQARARFRREARSAAGVHHSNIATVFDIGEARGEDYYVMEHIAGEDLLTRLKRDGPLDVLTTLQIGRQVAAALYAAWELSIVHRDLKPANLMLLPRRGGPARETRKGPKVKVVDFGLAKAIKAAGEVADAGGHSTGMSGTLRPVFTAAYASPEQIDGADDLDIRSDLYSLGVTLWHCLVGHPTFGNTSQQKAVVGHLSKEPPFGDLHAAGVPTPLIALFVRLLAKDPADRPATPAALLDDLEGLLNGEVPAPPPVAPPTPEPPAPMPIPAAADHSFTLAEVLRQRGVLPPAEAWTLLEALAPLVDDSWNGGPGGEVTAATAAAGGDLDPARIRVRLAESPPTPGSLRELPGRPVGEWPACTLELDAAEERYPMGFGHTRPGPRGRAALSPAGALAALGCELVGGHPPAPGPWRPLSALDEAGNELLREALRPDTSFRSAGELAGALRQDPVALPSAAPPPSAPAPPAEQRPTRRGWLLAGCIGGAVVGVLLLTMSRSERKSEPGRLAVGTPTPSPVSTPEPTLGRSPAPTPQPIQAFVPTLVPTPIPASTPTPTPALLASATEQAGQFLNQGNAAAQAGNKERAVADYTRAIELDPKYAFAYNNRGTIYYDLKQHERAVADYTRAIALDFKFDFVYKNRGDAYRALGKETLAQQDFAKAKELTSAPVSAPSPSPVPTSTPDQSSTRFVNVIGAVKSPQQVAYTSDMTVVAAINAAGDFSDFANQSKVVLSRGGKRQIINCKEIMKHPEKDVRVEPGDQILVPESFF